MATTAVEVKKETTPPATTEKGAPAVTAPAKPAGIKTIRLKDLKPFSAEVIKESWEKINNCYQCKKCSNGCPVTYAMDYPPHQVIKMIQLGQEKEVLTSTTIWICAACETCGTRCPNEIKFPGIMDALRQMAEKKGYALGQKNASIFHRSFMDSVKKYGRVYEIGMIRNFVLKSSGVFGKLFDGSMMRDGKLGMRLIRKGKLSFSSQKIKGTDEIKNIFNKAQKG